MLVPYIDDILTGFLGRSITADYVTPNITQLEPSIITHMISSPLSHKDEPL